MRQKRLAALCRSNSELVIFEMHHLHHTRGYEMTLMRQCYGSLT